MACNSIKKNTNKVCIGDMDKRIAIQKSSITPNNSPSAQSIIGFTTIASAWALVKTSANNDFIDGVNTRQTITTDFYIRYNSSIDFARELYVLYNSILFRVVSSDNIDKDDNIIRIRTVEHGSSSINVNKR